MEKHRANKIKKVNILSRVPIRNVIPPIHGCHNGIMMDTSNILKCINKRAVVNEVLPDGSTIRLNLSNYYKDNYVTPVVEPVNNPEPVVAVAEEAKKVEEVVSVPAEVAIAEVDPIPAVDGDYHADIDSISSDNIVVEDANTNGIADIAVTEVETVEPTVEASIEDITQLVGEVTTETVVAEAVDTADQVVVDDDDSNTNTDDEEVSAVAEAADDHVPTYKNKKNKNHRH